METKRSSVDNGAAIPLAGRLGGNQHFALSSRDIEAHTHAPVLPFAGRIGGNQDFTVDRSDPSGSNANLIKRTPDAAPLLTLKDSLDLKGFYQIIIWKSAIIEFWGTAMFVFTVGLAAAALSPYHETNPLAVPLIGALVNWIALSLFIYTAAPASGGHLNPFITMSTFTAGLSTFPRSLLYILGQCIGALCGSFILKLGLGGDVYYPSGVVTGCTIDTSLISYGQAYVLETGAALSMVFVSFGVGLDPRQSQVLGAALSPVLVGLTVALGSFATSFVKEGWYGASLNPARCFGLMAAKEAMGGHWIHWLAALTASLVNALFYHFIPPYHNETA